MSDMQFGIVKVEQTVVNGRVESERKFEEESHLVEMYSEVEQHLKSLMEDLTLNRRRKATLEIFADEHGVLKRIVRSIRVE